MNEPPIHYTIEEYRRLEELAFHKHEYHQGRVYERSGLIFRHSLIITNCISTLHQLLSERDYCIFGSDFRVNVNAKNFEGYPDSSVLCGEAELVGNHHAYANPLLIVEIPLPASVAPDYGPKFDLYKELDSLQYYLQVERDRPHVTCFTRQNDQWAQAVAEGVTDTLEIPGLNITIPLSEIYLHIEFPPAPEN